MSQDLPPPIALFRLATGYYVSCAIHAVARLGIADRLKDGAQSHEALAIATGTHAAALRRAGVPATNARFGGVVHDFVMINDLHDTEAAKAAVLLAAASLKVALT